MLGMGSSQTGRMGRASMGRGREGEIVLIRKLPPASPSHPSTQLAGQSRSTLVSAENDKLVNRGQVNIFALKERGRMCVCVLVLDKNLPIPATKSICYVIVTMRCITGVSFKMLLVGFS